MEEDKKVKKQKKQKKLWAEEKLTQFDPITAPQVNWEHRGRGFRGQDTGYPRPKALGLLASPDGVLHTALRRYGA